MKLALLLLGWSAIAAADVAKAKTLNNDGMKLYAKKDYAAALAKFDKAIAEDPSMVLAHYNAASMASLMGKSSRVIKELEWLSSSKDATAVKALEQGKTDRDLDRAVMHPRVRELVGLPPLDKIDLATLLLERGAVWGADGGACGALATTLTFKKGGTFNAHTEFACDANEHAEDETGKWSVKDGKLTVTSKKLFSGGMIGLLTKCERDEDGQCLQLDGNQSFHRGPGEMH